MPCTTPAARSPCRSCTPGATRYHPSRVAPSESRSRPSRPFKPERHVDQGGRPHRDRLRPAPRLARKAGYDGVEIMGSEGYLINQFLALAHQRPRPTSGVARRRSRMRFAVEIVRAVARARRRRLHRRLPHLGARPRRRRPDLGRDSRRSRVEVEAAGRDILNTRHRLARGAGADDRHLGAARRPACRMPRGSRSTSSVPVVATNRINMPEVAEYDARRGRGRPRLAGAALPGRPGVGAQGRPRRADEINTCIACNQACLDHIFDNQRATCLVNPRAGHETELVLLPTRRTSKKVAVVGAGPAGLAAATSCRRPRPRGRALRGARRGRRPVRPRDARSPARRSSPRRSATSRAGSRSAASRSCSTPAPTADDLAGFDEVSSRPASSRACRRSPGSTTRWS